MMSGSTVPMKWPGGTIASTRDPSMPSHQNVCRVHGFVSFQMTILFVRKYFRPLRARIWGMAQERPKTSGCQQLSARRPNSASKNFWPWRIWRTNDSPEIRLQSGSTQKAPVSSHRPSATRRFTSSYISGK